MTANLQDLEKISKRYAETKLGGKGAESADIAVEIINLFSSPDFDFKVKDAKFGPGEILVTDSNKEAADAKLTKAIKKLKELTHAKKAESSFR